MFCDVWFSPADNRGFPKNPRAVNAPIILIISDLGCPPQFYSVFCGIRVLLLPGQGTA